jgi:RHS repeat-associated protein
VAKYSYLPDSDLISGWSNGILQTVRSFEHNRDLISAVENQSGSSLISRFDYANDAIARRTQRIDTGRAGPPDPPVTNRFGYNPRSELTNAVMGTNAYGYAYDAIGNRLAVTNNAEALTYAANALNQYTNITDGDVVGPQYDLDGNLTNFNGWAFTWDGENRLVLALNAATVVSNSYDYLSRRVAKTVNGSARQFIYDGWAMVQESAGAQTNSYVYGLDLSGSIQGAGMIGGLLSASLNGTHAFYFYDANGNVSDLTATNGASLAHYEWDPYGNATASTGSLVAANPFRFSTKYADDETVMYYYGYRYYSPELGRWLSRDPIGERGGTLTPNRDEFSVGDLIALLWSLRASSAGISIYGFVENDPMNRYDPSGLFSHQHDCNASQIAAIRAAESTSKAGASSAETILVNQFDEVSVIANYPRIYTHPIGIIAHYRVWFRGTKSTLSKVNAGYTANSYGVECECSCDEGTRAYCRPGNPFDDDIHFCPLFFSKTATSQAEIFLHEMSHIFANTSNLALGGGRPWARNAEDAYWIEGLATNPFSQLDMFMRVFTTRWSRP